MYALSVGISSLEIVCMCRKSHQLYQNLHHKIIRDDNQSVSLFQPCYYSKKWNSNVSLHANLAYSPLCGATPGPFLYYYEYFEERLKKSDAKRSVWERKHKLRRIKGELIFVDFIIIKFHEKISNVYQT